MIETYPEILRARVRKGEMDYYDALDFLQEYAEVSVERARQLMEEGCPVIQGGRHGAD